MYGPVRLQVASLQSYLCHECHVLRRLTLTENRTRAEHCTNAQVRAGLFEIGSWLEWRWSDGCTEDRHQLSARCTTVQVSMSGEFFICFSIFLMPYC